MGVGFKSVYKFAQAAYIRSGPYSFSFQNKNHRGRNFGWIIVPSWCEQFPVLATNTRQTVFYFPYLRTNRRELRNRLESFALTSLSGISLVFLRHLSTVTVLRGGN